MRKLTKKEQHYIDAYNIALTREWYGLDYVYTNYSGFKARAELLILWEMREGGQWLCYFIL